MVRAVDGMIKEKDAIFASLIISVLLFQLETLAAGFLVMDQNAAIACSMILGIGTYYWYKYCTRIYHRFKVSYIFDVHLSCVHLSQCLALFRSIKFSLRGKILKMGPPRMQLT